MTSIAREQPWRSYPMRCRLSNEDATIMVHTHQTAPTQFVEAQKLRDLATWYLQFADRAGNPAIWEARLRTAEDLEKKAASLAERRHEHRNEGHGKMRSPRQAIGVGVGSFLLLI